MPFLIRPSRRFPVCCPVTYQCGDFEGHGTVWNLSYTGGDSLAICRCDQGNILVDRHAAEEKTVKDLVLELIDLKIQELEKKGLLPKGKV